MEQYFSDYRDFGGFRRPARVVQRTMGQEQIVTIDSVSIGDVPDSAFEPPAEVRTRSGGPSPEAN